LAIDIAMASDGGVAARDCGAELETKLNSEL
jgi:hypothetical protein